MPNSRMYSQCCPIMPSHILAVGSTSKCALSLVSASSQMRESCRHGLSICQNINRILAMTSLRSTSPLRCLAMCMDKVLCSRRFWSSSPIDQSPPGQKLNTNQDLGIKVATPVGTLVGQLLFGWLADVVGRKRMCKHHCRG